MNREQNIQVMNDIIALLGQVIAETARMKRETKSFKSQASELRNLVLANTDAGEMSDQVREQHEANTSALSSKCLYLSRTYDALINGYDKCREVAEEYFKLATTMRNDAEEDDDNVVEEKRRQLVKMAVVIPHTVIELPLHGAIHNLSDEEVCHGHILAHGDTITLRVRIIVARFALKFNELKRVENHESA